jgi:hypothetical protein
VDHRQKPVHLCGETLQESHHICAFFNTSDERYRVLMPFIREGMEQGDKAFHIVNPSLRSHHTQRITEAGIDIARAETEGQLEIVGWDDAPLRGGRFNQSAMLSLLRAIFDKGKNQGFPLTRFISEMEWVLNDPEAADRLLEFECRANLAIPKDKDVVICAYDLDKFSAAIVIDALRTHPMVIIGKIAQHNPFFVPPEELLKELQEGESFETGRSAQT